MGNDLQKSFPIYFFTALSHIQIRQQTAQKEL